MVALLLAALFQTTAPAAAATAPSAPPAKARLACRKETVVGSTIKRKVCPRKIVEVAQNGAAEASEAAEVSGDPAK